MTRYFLTALSIEGFRGINNEGQPLSLKFVPDKVNSIFATNGMGKSSIFDALQFALSGSVARLSRLQSSENPTHYVSNLFHGQSKATVQLELTSDNTPPVVTTVRVVKTANGQIQVSSPSGNPDPRALLADLNRDYALLDYSSFHEFIQSSALERGRSFAPLLGLAEYSNTRRCLQAASDRRALNSELDVRGTQAALEVEERREREAIAALTSLTGALTGDTPTDVSTINEWPERIVSALSGVPLLAGHLEGQMLAAIDFDAIREVIANAEGGTLRQELSNRVADRTALDALEVVDLDAVEDDYNALWAESEALTAALTETRGPRTRALLDSAHNVLASQEWHDELSCPLCSSSLDDSITETIDGAIAKYRRVDEAASRLRERLSAGQWAVRLAQLESSQLVGPGSDVRSRLLAKLAALELTSDDVAAASGRLSELESSLKSKHAVLTSEIGELERDLPPSLVGLTAQVDRAQAAARELRTYQNARRAIDLYRRRLDVYQGWIQFISMASGSFGDAESSLAQSVLESLKENYQDMFAKIMTVADVIPELDRDDSGENLDVTLEQFHGIKSISAKAVLPESYRNALAISVFLSAAHKQRSAPRFVVLDDITSSFDTGHQFQLMDYIRTKLQYPAASDGLQFIVLSHDVTLEKYFDRVSSAGGDWKHQKLHGWPPYTPLTVTAQRSDRLRKQAESFVLAGQLEQAAGVLRQYLEFVLIQIISRVQIPVPLDLAVKDHAKMVQTCLDSISYAVEIHNKVGTLVLEEQQVVDLTSHHVPAIVGNWVSHYGTSGSAAFSPPALLGVIKNIEELENCFKHESPAGSGRLEWYKSLTRR